jgi:glutathione S-transferase
MEVKRLLSVLEDHLLYRAYIMDQVCTIADMAIFPWVHQLRQGYRHKTGMYEWFVFILVSCNVVAGWFSRDVVNLYDVM